MFVSVGGVVPGPVTGDLIVASFHAAGFCRRYRASYDVRFQHFLGSPMPRCRCLTVLPSVPRATIETPKVTRFFAEEAVEHMKTDYDSL